MTRVAFAVGSVLLRETIDRLGAIESSCSLVRDLEREVNRRRGVQAFRPSVATWSRANARMSCLTAAVFLDWDYDDTLPSKNALRVSRRARGTIHLALPLPLISQLPFLFGDKRVF